MLCMAVGRSANFSIERVTKFTSELSRFIFVSCFVYDLQCIAEDPERSLVAYLLHFSSKTVKKKKSAKGDAGIVQISENHVMCKPSTRSVTTVSCACLCELWNASLLSFSLLT